MNQAGHFQRVTRSLGWTLLGELCFAAGHFGLLVVMARMGSQTALGRYALGLAIATPLFVLTSLHLRPTYVVTDDARFEFGHYLTLRLVAIPATIGTAIVWSLGAGHDLATLVVVALVALIRGSEMLADIFHAAAGRAEALRRVGISRALRGSTLLASVALALLVGLEVPGALAIGALAGLVLTLGYDLPTARAFVDVRPRWSGPLLLCVIKLAAPVGLAGGLLGLTMNTPTYVLEGHQGVDAVGRYAAVISILYVGGVFNAAVGNAAIPRLARLYPERRREFRRVFIRVMVLVGAVGLCIVAGCWALGELYLRLAYGPAFVDLQGELLLAGGIVAAAGLANLCSQTVVAMRAFTLQFVIACGGTILALLVSFALVPSRGLSGALAALGIITIVRLLVYLSVIGAALVRPRGSRSSHA